MIELGPASPDFSPALLAEPGAFVWWYVDLVEPSGRGAVLLWSFGLPFLPGARASATTPPLARPALSLAIYERGGAPFYLLQALEPERCAWDGQAWRMERSTFVERVEAGRVRLHADLDLPLPGGSWASATLDLEGPLRHGGEGPRSAGHSWEPVTAGSATGELRVASDGQTWTIRGRAYHDRNGGARPLHDQGIREWRWARLAFPGRDIVLYAVEGEVDRVRLFEIDAHGRMAEIPEARLVLGEWRRGRLGFRWPSHLVVESAAGRLDLHQALPLEEGPFYFRFAVRGTFGGEEGVGFAEHVLAERLDLPLHRPFVRMRVHATRGPNSMWLPLFSGPREGRLRRLLGADR